MDRRPQDGGAGPSTGQPAPSSTAAGSSHRPYPQPSLSSHSSYGSPISLGGYSAGPSSLPSGSRPLPAFPQGMPSAIPQKPYAAYGQPPQPPGSSASHRSSQSQHFPSLPFNGQQQQPKLMVQPPTSPGQCGPSSAPALPSGSHVLSPFNAPPPRSATSPTPAPSGSNGLVPSPSGRFGTSWGRDWREATGHGGEADDESCEDEHHGLAYLGAGRRNDSLGAQSSEGGRSSASSHHSDTQAVLQAESNGSRGPRSYRSPSDASSPGRLGVSGPPSASNHQHASYGPSIPSQGSQGDHSISRSLYAHQHNSSQTFHPTPPHPAFSSSSSRSNTPSSQGAYDSSGRPASLLSSSPPSQHSYPHGSSSPYPYKGPGLDSSSALSHTSQSGPANSANSHATASGAVNGGTPCGACSQSVTGPFVRALNTIYHLDCFRCQVSPARISAFHVLSGRGLTFDITLASVRTAMSLSPLSSFRLKQRMAGSILCASATTSEGSTSSATLVI